MIELITTLADGSIYALDVNPVAPIALSKTFLELQDFTKRKGDFSKSFDLPRTPRNDYFFGLFGDPSTIGAPWNPQYLSVCWLLEDSNIVIEGVLKLESTDHKHSRYTVSIAGTVAQIKDAIGDKGMNDLDMAAWAYSNADIYGSWNRSFASGNIVFSVNDFGFGLGLYKKKNTGNVIIDVTDAACTDTINLEKTLPTFRLNELLRMIFTEAGFIVSGSWFSETSAEDIYVQSDNPLSKYYSPGDNVTTEVAHTIILSTSYQNVPLKANPSAANFNDASHEWTAPIAGTFRFDWGVRVTPGTPATSIGLVRQIQKNGVVVSTVTQTWNIGNAQTDYISCAAADTVRLQVRTLGGETTAGSINIGDNCFLNMVGYVPSGTSFDPSEHLANYKQIDFLREIIGIFNLILWKPSTEEVRLDTWEYYMATYGTKKDWSNKVDLSRPPKISPINSELTNPINLELKKADDILNQEYIRVTGRAYGSYREDTRIPFTKPPQAPFKIFAPAPYQEADSSVAGAAIPSMVIGKFYGSVDDVTYKPPGLQLLYYCGVYTFAPGPYLYVNRFAGSACFQHFFYPVFSPFKLTAGAWPYSGTDWRVQASTLDLNFTWFDPPTSTVDAPATQNLYERYFKEMLRERYDEANKIIEFNAMLTPADISNFNFADTIVITLNGTPVGLKILEIKDYSPNVEQSTKIKAMISFIK